MSAAPAPATPESLGVSLDQLGRTALRIKAKRDSLVGTLHDILTGAAMCEPYFTGAALDYIREVKRVAAAGLREAGECAPRLPIDRFVDGYSPAGAGVVR